jgi:hypothetical protein
LTPGGGKFSVIGRRAVRLEWACADGTRLAAIANLGHEAIDAKTPLTGASIHVCPEHAAREIREGRMPPWSVAWALESSPQR